jgi:hypothetical protein
MMGSCLLLDLARQIGLESMLEKAGKKGGACCYDVILRRSCRQREADRRWIGSGRRDITQRRSRRQRAPAQRGTEEARICAEPGG